METAIPEETLRSREGMQTNVWGGPLWFALHCMAMTFPLAPVDDARRAQDLLRRCGAKGGRTGRARCAPTSERPGGALRTTTTAHARPLLLGGHPTRPRPVPCPAVSLLAERRC